MHDFFDGQPILANDGLGLNVFLEQGAGEPGQPVGAGVLGVDGAIGFGGRGVLERLTVVESGAGANDAKPTLGNLRAAP